MVIEAAETARLHCFLLRQDLRLPMGILQLHSLWNWSSLNKEWF